MIHSIKVAKIAINQLSGANFGQKQTCDQYLNPFVERTLEKLCGRSVVSMLDVCLEESDLGC